MSTLTMMRTVCCEGHRIHGKRCSLCPNRPENQEALQNYKVAVSGFSLRSAVAACEAVELNSNSRSSTLSEQRPAAPAIRQ